ncbi:MAG TPA: GAF domain-containing protein, partial [Anaerolineaceae bacterium]|nr:GAF domain-containing protein [Anaerolineaceae bacterium]
VILNCEAGSLLLVDEDTGELVFKVVIGAVADDLVGKRMPPGRGLVGKAILSGEALIANDVQRLPDWFPINDQRTGFVTRALIVNPLVVKDRTIGVIEVINRQDGQPFNQRDLDLLSAFGGQAAVAIENARLYTLTDQALTARVEELSMMQRIDRELNATLDTQHAMQTTLEWAMRQTHADAGLIGWLGEDGCRVIAAQGYDAELEAYRGQPIPLETPFLQTALDNKEVRCTHLPSGMLSGTQCQLIAPIRREDRTIGVLLLENRSDHICPDEILTFMTRLCDHAAFAISNSQLYAAVQTANQAKSDFISFISHELKNPMTAIRGYTDLMAAGAGGAVTDTQAKFLHTIATNVERMASLVSDLADMSRIEAGRLKLQMEAVPLAPAIEEVLLSNRRLLDEKQHVVSQSIPADLPDLFVDRIRLVQILTNLVNNAAKYTPANGVIEIGAETALGGENDAVEGVRVWVKDSGYGITPAEQVHIFEKFFRSEDSQIRDMPGTGLGLNITRSLVEVQGGRIWFT